MPTFLVRHSHRPEECAIAIAAWKGFYSPLRGGRPLGTCHAGGHQLWWIVEAPDRGAALAQLPPFVAARSALDQVRMVQIP